MKNRIVSNLDKAVDVASSKSQTRGLNTISAGIACGTWQAISRRSGGAYTTSRKAGNVPHHWNEDFALIFMDTLALSWKNVFQTRLPNYHQRFSSDITKALEEFKVSFSKSISDVCGTYPSAENILDKIPLMEDNIREAVAELLKRRQEVADVAQGTIRGSIRAEMKPLYDEFSQESGMSSKRGNV